MIIYVATYHSSAHFLSANKCSHITRITHLNYDTKANKCAQPALDCGSGIYRGIEKSTGALSE